MQEATTTDRIADLLDEYKCLLDRKDELNAQVSTVVKSIDDIEHRIRSAMEVAGQTNDGDKVSAAGITVTMRQKWRAKYAPEHWSDVVRWAVEQGFDHIVQRRLSDAKVMELVDNGVTLPKGLNVEQYTDLDFRRSK